MIFLHGLIDDHEHGTWQRLAICGILWAAGVYNSITLDDP